MVSPVDLLDEAAAEAARAARTWISKWLRLVASMVASHGDDAVIRRLFKGATIRKLDERWNRILREEKFIPMEEP